MPRTESERNVLLSRGESAVVERKRTTGERREAMQTVCAFLHGHGGLVVIGVRPDGRVEGQQVSDQTLRDVAEKLDGFAPPCVVPLDRLRLGNGREALFLTVAPVADAIPFSFEGRSCKRVGSTTRQMTDSPRLGE